MIVKPDVVRFRDIRQAVDGIQHLRQALLVLLVHGRQQFHRLGQRFMAVGEFFEAVVNAHGGTRNSFHHNSASAARCILDAWSLNSSKNSTSRA